MSRQELDKGLALFHSRAMTKDMSQASLDLIIQSDDILFSSSTDPRQIQRSAGEIGIRDGKIVAIEDEITQEAKQRLDYRGFTVLPGIIDSQVHFRDPGLSHKEDFAHGTRAAIQGGVTAIFDMPNTKPNTSSRERFIEKQELCREKAYCDFGLFIGATNENSEELAELETLPGCCGVKIFMGASTGDLLVAEDENLKKVLAGGSRRVAVHCEDNHILSQRKPLAESAANPKAHPIWRNVDSAFQATQRILKLARETRRPIHTLHITTGQELELLAQNKDLVTVECLPQHLFFSSPDCYDKLGTKTQMNPPIREIEHQKALWQAIDNDIIDVIGSDHAPHTIEEKQKTYPNSPSGMPGVQTILPIMLNFVHQQKLSLEKMVRLLSINPAQIYRAEGKGGIFVGQDADFSVVDLKKSQTIEDSWIESLCGWTPYNGVEVTGWPKATIVRGKRVMQDGEILAEKHGEPITFHAMSH